jgi:hypothetical protein
MRKFLSGSSLLFVTLSLLFVLFSSWYDGWWISPLTPQEGEVLFKALSGDRAENQLQSKINRKSVEAFARTDDGGEFYMLNLIKNKKENDPNGADTGGDSTGVDKRYTSVVFPLLFQRGCHPVLVSKPLSTFSLPTIDEEWDAIFVIRYRSRRDLLEIVTTEAFQNAWGHKLATVEKTVVIPSSPILPGISLKWIFGLLLLVIGWVGHKLIQRRRKKTQGTEEA